MLKLQTATLPGSPLVAPHKSADPAWYGTNQRHRRRAPRQHRWRWRLWARLLPFPRRQRIWLTLPGALLAALAFAIGGAAYNTSNNILFITLSLLLSCLLLSGALSWLNFSRLRWRLRVRPPMRAGVEHSVLVEVRNDKRILPTFALRFDCLASDRALMSIGLSGRLDPGQQEAAEWRLRPARRGRLRLELVAAVSVFPFGFLRKAISIGQAQEIPVWPAAVAYQSFPGPQQAQARAGVGRAVGGPRGADLRALRRYAPGDPPHTVHWKATARARRLLVREFVPEQDAGVVMWLQTPAERWPHAEQFELLCGLAATLAEDLFHAGQLRAIALGDGPAAPVRGAREVEAFLDRLAGLEPDPQPESRMRAPPATTGLMTFAPEGARGVTAYVDGIKAAAA